jgi:hypothetical protein
MLCGRAPYISQGWGDVLMMHMSDEIPVASKESSRVPAAIDQVIKTALAKKKSDRYSSMRDMHRALAQARHDVEDTPAPLVKTDPVLAPMLVGVDALAGRASSAAAAPEPASALASGDAFPEVDPLTPAPLRWLRAHRRAAMIGGGVLGAVILTLALWRPGSRPDAPPAAAVHAPEAKAPEAVPSVGPAAGKEPVAGSPVHAGASPGTGDDGADTGSPPKGPEGKSAAGKSPEAKSTGEKAAKLKTAKSNHRLARRKDPVKW